MARILLCDDNKTILLLLEKRLTDAGHQIVGKGQDGNEGSRLFAEVKPDLMLLDITMPNKDGRECLTEILSKDPKAKVVMVTALHDDEIMQTCLASGAKGFINKEKLYKTEQFQNDVLPILLKALQAA